MARELDAIDEAKELIENARKITVLTGAGISTDSGIPDFRGPNGKWTLDPESEKITDIKHYISSPKIRQKNWDGYINSDWSQYEPNTGHMAIKKLYDEEKLLAVITQNIDGLHVKSGIPEERVLEMHGTLREVICIDCGETYDSKRFVNKEPQCIACADFEEHGIGLGGYGGLLKPNVVFFGEPLNQTTWTRAENAAAFCDLMLVVGTTLIVWPVAELPLSAAYGGIDTIWVNGSGPPDHFNPTINIKGSISEVLEAIV